MSTKDFAARALASLQETVLELRNDLPSGRKREFAACAGRVLGRLRADAAAPDLAAQRLGEWRRLNEAAPVATDADPLQELYAQAAQVGRTLDRLGGALDAASTPWFRRAVSATRHYLEACETALPAPASAAAEAGEPPDAPRARLSHYLAARYPALPSDPVRSLRIVPGGRGKETSLFELSPNPILPSRLVLRRDLALSVTGASAYAEFPLLKAVEALGLPVPTAILAEKDAAHLGGSFIIMTEVTDSTAGGELFAELNDLTRLDCSFPIDLVRALALLHTLRAHPSGAELAGHSAGGADPLEMVRTFQQLFRAIAHKPPLHLATELGFAWLLANPPPKHRPHRLVHGDVGLHNVLVREGKLAAILDWELAHMGDPAEDIAYAWSPLLRHLMTWNDFKRVYQGHGGDAAAYDAHAVAWYSVWAHTRNSVYVAMHYDWAADGRRRDIECFNAGTDFFARTQYYIARELDDALGNAS